MEIPRDIDPLVNYKWLKEEIDKGLPDNVVVCDVSWASTTDMKSEYSKCHIPGAIFMSVFDETEFTDIYPRNIPKLETFEEIAREAGINSNDHVVLYSNSDINGFLVSGRALLVFKLYGHKNISILNGGLKKWMSVGYPTTDIVPTRKRGNFKASFDAGTIAKFEDVEAIANSQSIQICDSRASSKFSGQSSSGHIVKAVNIPLSSLMSEDGELKNEKEIKEDFRKAGVDLSKPMVTYCNSGMSSCSLAIIGSLCGCPQSRVYLGGFTEWSKRAPSNLIEKTE